MKNGDAVLMESDESLIGRVLQGDQRAFEQLVARHQETVARFIYKVVPNDQDREEVCQDVFVKLFFKLDQFRFDSKFTTWLYQVAYRSAISFNRRKRLDTVPIEDVDLGVSVQADEDSETIKNILDSQLAGLKLEERTIVALHYLQDVSVEEIGAIVERPGGTVKSILHRVRKKLHHSLGQQVPELKESYND